MPQTDDITFLIVERRMQNLHEACRFRGAAAVSLCSGGRLRLRVAFATPGDSSPAVADGSW